MRARGVTLLLVAAATSAAGQERTASLEVWLHAGSPAARIGVVVAAERLDGPERAACQTREDGRCVLLALAPGRYRVGPVPATDDTPPTIVEVAPGEHVRLALGEQARSTGRGTRGTATGSEVDDRSRGTTAGEGDGRSVGRDAIGRLPAGRPLLDAFRLGAASPSTGDWRLDWAASSEPRLFVEGLEWPVAGWVWGRSVSVLPEALGALRFDTRGASPSGSDRGTAGAIHAVLRSGGARRAAELALSYEGAQLAGAARPFSRYSPWDDNRVERNLTVPPTPSDGRTVTASLGGPLGPRGLSAHVSVSSARRDRHREAVFIDDPERVARRFSWFSWSWQGSAAVTAAARQGRRARLVAIAARGRNRGSAPALEPDQGTLPDGTSTAGLTRAAFLGPTETLARWHDTGGDSRRVALSPSLDWPLGSNAVLSADASISIRQSWTPASFRGRETRHVFATSNARVPGIPRDAVHAASFSDSRSSYGTVRDGTRRIQAGLDARWSPGRRAAHQFSAGIRGERLTDSVYIGHARPVIRLHWNQALVTRDGRSVRGPYGYYTVSRPGTIGDAAGTTVAAWLQDRWSPSEGLTLEAGVRAERESPASYAEGGDVRRTAFGLDDTIAPRLSLRWRPDERGDWRLSGSFGLYVDHLTTQLARSLFGARHDVRESWTLDTLDWQALECDEGHRDCPGRFIERTDARPPWNVADPQLSALLGGPAARVDPGLRPMRSVEWEAGLERRVGRGFAVAVRYTGKRLLEAVEDVGIRLPDGGETSVLANPGSGYGALAALAPSFPAPRAARRYDGLDVEVRRSGRPVAVALRYRFSRLSGNYGGLAAADEGGRESTNLTAAFDSPFSSFDRYGHPVNGPLPGDRPHRLGFEATAGLPSGTTIALAGVVESGRPESSQVSLGGIPVYFNGYGDLGRQPPFSQLDLQVRQDVRMGRAVVTLEAAVDNLLDQAAPLGYFSTNRYRDDLPVPDAAFLAVPWDPAAWAASLRAAGVRIRDEQLYLEPDRFQRARRITLTARLQF